MNVGKPVRKKVKGTESDVCYIEVDVEFNREPVELGDVYSGGPSASCFMWGPDLSLERGNVGVFRD